MAARMPLFYHEEWGENPSTRARPRGSERTALPVLGLPVRRGAPGRTILSRDAWTELPFPALAHPVRRTP
jgi:hypothetical protein